MSGGPEWTRLNTPGYVLGQTAEIKHHLLSRPSHSPELRVA